MVEEGHLGVTPPLDLFFVELKEEIAEFSRQVAPLMNAEAVFALVVCLDGDPIHSIVKFWGIMNKVVVAGLTRWT